MAAAAQIGDRAYGQVCRQPCTQCTIVEERRTTLFCHVGSEVGKNQWSRINALWSKRWLPISTQTVLAASIQSKPFPNMTEEGLCVVPQK